MGVSSIVIWWRQRRSENKCCCEQMVEHMYSPVVGTSVVTAYMWDSDSIRESNLAVYCFVEEGQTKKFSAIC